MSVLTRNNLIDMLGLTSTQLDNLNDLSGTELTALNGITLGTVAASKAVTVDSNKDAGSFRNLTATGTITADKFLGSPVSEVVTAANVITAAESGSVFFLNSATEFASTLPAPALGLTFTFIVSAAPSGASYTITTNSSANIIKGQVFTSDVDSATDADFETSGGDTISFVDAKAVAGDTVVVISDGTNWFARCFCSVFDAITITTAS